MAVSHDGLPPCSEADLGFMRQQVYNAAFIRDVGRTKDDLLLCATGIGRLPKPYPIAQPDIVARGARIHVSLPLAFAPHATGLSVERAGVSMILNPGDYWPLDESPMLFGAWLYVPEQNVLMHSFGHEFPLTPAEITSGRMFVKNGIVYRSSCASAPMSCIVVSVPERNLPVPMRAATVLAVVLGPVLGAALVGLVILYLQTQRSLERQLRKAVRNGEITLEYQPVVDLSTGRVVAAEALARWTRPNGERIGPALFVSVAEQRGFITELTRHVLSVALHDLQDLLERGGFYVTVNISSHDLDDDNFPELLQEALSKAHVPASSIALELTERSTAHHATAVAAIKRLREMGHPVYIDDFGTGFSSLSYLHELAVNGIKIDRAFTKTVGTGAATSSVVPQILSMVQQLGLKVVVEGIETQAQSEYFAQSSPGALGQGWFFSRAVPAALLRDLVERRAEQASPVR
jgi:sensor c-di-GMP phosphodiesterase-like protein